MGHLQGIRRQGSARLYHGLSQRLQLFQMRDVRRIVCNDDIRLEEIGARKTALFLVISDDNASMQTLSSLMFSFLLKDLKEAS